jgi:hypothetical protein
MRCPLSGVSGHAFLHCKCSLLTQSAGIFDIPGTTTGASITTLSGVINSGVALGGKALTLSNASTTYSAAMTGVPFRLASAMSAARGKVDIASNQTWTSASTATVGSYRGSLNRWATD